MHGETSLRRVDAIARAQASTFIRKLDKVPELNGSEANDLGDCFNSSLFSAGARHEFARKLAQKLSVASGRAASVSGARTNQEIDIENCMLTSRWVNIDNPSIGIGNRNSKACQICSVILRLLAHQSIDCSRLKGSKNRFQM